MTSNEQARQSPQTRGSVFTDLPIGAKLAIGFGILVLLAFLGAGVSYFGSALATSKIEKTDEVRVPTSLIASKAQLDLVQMQAEVRGYLVFGDSKYRKNYEEAAAEFEKDLDELRTLLQDQGGVDKVRLDVIWDAYDEWKPLPPILFELRADQLEREPAYRLMATDATLAASDVLINTRSLIQSLGAGESTSANQEALGAAANFQATFAYTFSALRGYTTTRNRLYRGEFDSNLTANNQDWDRLFSKRDQLTDNQQALLDTISTNREKYLSYPDEIFSLLEGERWREDLFFFDTQAVPVAERMNKLLNDMTGEQQTKLRTELAAGRADLSRSNLIILSSGFVALVIGLGMAFLSRATIAQPIGRLTDVAEQIREGDLEAQAKVESRDEIGTLASTFNRMTGQLRSTLFQVRKEKKRADDLLDVVIPYGVQLTTEKDFNRLLERMLIEAKSFCRADAGVLYLRSEDNQLTYTIVRNDTLNIALGGTTGNAITFDALPLIKPDGQPNRSHVVTRAAVDGETVNLVEAGKSSDVQVGLVIDGKHAELSQYAVQSLLAIPLKNSDGQVLGVLELVNAVDQETKKVALFDNNLQRMMESFSSMAVAALEAYIREQKLRNEIYQLRIEVDEARRAKQVEEVVNTDFFQDLSQRAQELRERHRARTKDDK